MIIQPITEISPMGPGPSALVEMVLQMGSVAWLPVMAASVRACRLAKPLTLLTARLGPSSVLERLLASCSMRSRHRYLGEHLLRFRSRPIWIHPGLRGNLLVVP